MANHTHMLDTTRKPSLKPKGFRQNVGSLLISTLAINVLSLALPIMTLQVYDRILPNPGSGTLPVLVIGVCLALGLEAILRLCRAFVIARSGAAYEHRMACMAMDRVLNADLCRLGSYGIGKHMHRMAAVGKLRDFHNGYSLTVITELMFVPLFLGLIIYISHALAVVPAFILGAFTLVSFWRGYRLRAALKNRENSDDSRFDFLIEALEGVHTLKSFALEKLFQRRYEQLEEDSTQCNFKVTQETANTFNIAAIFSHLMVASVISAGAWFVLHGMLTTGGLIATLLLSGRMMQPVQKGLALWARYQDYTLAKENLDSLFATPQYITGSANDKLHQAETSQGHLELKNVSFQFEGANTPLLKNINLEISRGQSILISGAHGAGKTVLLNLIGGLYPASSGEILIDGEPIAAYAPQDLVRHVGNIRSQTLIFRGTIRDNMTCFGQTSEAQAREIATYLNVDRDIAQLPAGFDTFLNGNNTDSISPGLKQRIAFVRALAQKPRLVLFDNADRTLDKDGYAALYNLFAQIRGKASMIVVTDDLNIRSLMQRHFVLHDGRLVENAAHSSAKSVRPYKELRL